MALLTEQELERLCGHFHAYGTEGVPAVVMRDLVDTLRAAWERVSALELFVLDLQDNAAIAERNPAAAPYILQQAAQIAAALLAPTPAAPKCKVSV